MSSSFLLHAAASAGDLEKVDELLSGGRQGGGIRLHVDDVDLQGRTVLHAACEAGREEVCRRLLAEPGDAKTNALYAKAAGLYGNTALHLAVGGGRAGVVDMLLRAAADVTAKNALGATPLHLAAAGGAGRLDMARSLMDAKAEVDARNRAGETPLHTCVANGHMAMVALLLNYGAAATAVTEEGETTLHLAAGCESTHPATLKWLLDANADPARRRRDGKRPLQVACENALVAWTGGLRTEAPYWAEEEVFVEELSLQDPLVARRRPQSFDSPPGPAAAAISHAELAALARRFGIALPAPAAGGSSSTDRGAPADSDA